MKTVVDLKTRKTTRVNTPPAEVNSRKSAWNKDNEGMRGANRMGNKNDKQ